MRDNGAILSSTSYLLLCGVLQNLLGYEPLAVSSLNLMHRFPVGKEKRLFFDAEIVCLQWWQHILLTYIIVFVEPLRVSWYVDISITVSNVLSLKEVFLTRTNTS